MNWDAVGAGAEVTAAVAVILTLLYLARQLRQSNMLAREDAQYHMLQNQISYYDRLAENPEYLMTLYGPNLSEDEVTRLRKQSAATSAFFKWNWEYLRLKEGIFGSTDVPTEGIRRELRNAKIAEEWSRQKHIFHPDFVKFMDTEIIPDAKGGDV
jgi:hypothetical protein